MNGLWEKIKELLLLCFDIKSDLCLGVGKKISIVLTSNPIFVLGVGKKNSAFPSQLNARRDYFQLTMAYYSVSNCVI